MHDTPSLIQRTRPPRVRPLEFLLAPDRRGARRLREIVNRYAERRPLDREVSE